MKRLLILLSLAMITACNSTGNSTLTERLDALFSAHYPAADAPGTAVLVMKGDEVLFEKCYGLADLCCFRSCLAGRFAKPANLIFEPTNR